MHGGQPSLVAVVVVAACLRWSLGQSTKPSRKDYCEYQGRIIPNREKIVLEDDPCVRCRCRKGELECWAKTCPELKCAEFIYKSGTCCPKCVTSPSSRQKDNSRYDTVAMTMGLDIASDGISQIVTLRLPPPPMIPPPPPSVMAAAMLTNHTETWPVATTTAAPPIEATLIPPKVRTTRAPPTPPPTPPPPVPTMGTTKVTPTSEPKPTLTPRPKPDDAWSKWCENGEPGAQGVKGDIGAPGSPGIQGLQGPQGTTGPTGESGSKGDRGEPGPQGQQGEPGEKGERGIPGPRGPIGPKGSFGMPGPRGPPGRKGPKGNTGKKGKKGDIGEKGPVGPEGPQGLPGHVGLPGPVGPPGNGTHGGQGPAGPMGPVGPPGLVGFPGSTGQQGPRGPKGDKGNPGNHVMEGQVIIVANEIAMRSIRHEAAIVYRMDDKKLYFRDTDEWNCLMTEGNMKVLMGPPGPPGHQGDEGPPGPQGPKGDKGNFGEYSGDDQALCGNFKIEGNEQCDDGNDINTDSCIYCRRSYCGDGYRQTGVEECDTFEFNGRTCDYYFSEYETMGRLRCSDRCRIDTGDCKVVRRRKRQLPPD